MLLQNPFMRVEIAPMGAELMRITDLERNDELLWNGDPAYWKRRSPILFPNVGKTYNNVVRIGGKTYPTSQHGFARDMEFACESSDETTACFLLRSNGETLARYPFPFELRIRYALCARSLRVAWEVSNIGDGEMAFTIGGHPAFRFASPGEPKEDYCLRFPGLDRLRYLLLDPASGTALPDETRTIELKDEVLPLSDALFANDALILDGGQVREAWLCRRDSSPRVGMRCPDFANFGVWSVKGAPFVCLEPWAGRCDDRGFEGELRCKPNVNRLNPGETFEKSYEILLP